ncbi:MAG: GntR family transcriptional regulator [Halanaerobiales bacterium]
MRQDYTKALPIYKEIALNIETAILEGELKSGERLSSLRESAVELEVNINTVMKAYNLLEDEGILTKERGLGFFVTEEAPGIIKEKRREVFYQYTVPELAKTLSRLEIDLEDLVEILKKEKQ